MQRRVVAVAGAICLGALAATTHAFSDSADAVTSMAIAGFVVASVVHLHGARGGPAASAVGEGTAAVASGWSAVPFVALAGVAIGFEVLNFFLLPRFDHPTVSSFLTVVAAHAWSRGLLFVGWLALGARLSSR